MFPPNKFCDYNVDWKVIPNIQAIKFPVDDKFDEVCVVFESTRDVEIAAKTLKIKFDMSAYNVHVLWFYANGDWNGYDEDIAGYETCNLQDWNHTDTYFIPYKPKGCVI